MSIHGLLFPKLFPAILIQSQLLLFWFSYIFVNSIVYSGMPISLDDMARRRFFITKIRNYPSSASLIFDSHLDRFKRWKLQQSCVESTRDTSKQSSVPKRIRKHVPFLF
eukprot:NODE_511_length_6663_cov_0.324345.p4 type:complete len:109 gc:universal NODE_511_length_6663_cov_0.324345:4836-4510(-)